MVQMRLLYVLALFIAACASPVGAQAPSANATASAATESQFPVDPADRACAQQTMTSLIQAMNTSDETRLRELLRSASIGIGELPATSPDEAVTRLLARGRAGERWALVTLDVNGRGGMGGVNFGVRLQRSGPGLAQPYKLSEGKGAFDCPDGRVLIFSAT
jgi:hypothetical protein